MDRELEKDRFPKNFATDAWTRAALLLKPGGREPEEMQVPIEAEKQKHWGWGWGAWRSHRDQVITYPGRRPQCSSLLALFLAS